MDICHSQTWTDPARDVANKEPLLVSLLVCSLALRPQLSGAGALLPAIQLDFGLSHAVGSLIGTLPLLCMGLFAIATRRLLAGIGSRNAMTWSLFLIGASGLGRALIPGPEAAILLTVPFGIGAGLAGALLPSVVKQLFSRRSLVATGAYSFGTNLGGALAAASAAPLAALLGGWRPAFAVFGLEALVLTGAWIQMTRGRVSSVKAGGVASQLGVHGVPAKRGWQVVLAFTLQGVCFYSLTVWLPTAYEQSGWSATEAGGLLSALTAASLAGTLLAAWPLPRVGSTAKLLVGAALLLGSMLGLVVAPAGAWLWAILAGGGCGATFTLALALVADFSPTPSDASVLAGRVLAIGYTVAAAAPFVVGALRDETGGFTAGFGVLVGAAASLLTLTIAMYRRRPRIVAATS